jgi:hypothetical protein
VDGVQHAPQPLVRQRAEQTNLPARLLDRLAQHLQQQHLGQPCQHLTVRAGSGLVFADQQRPRGSHRAGHLALRYHAQWRHGADQWVQCRIAEAHGCAQQCGAAVAQGAQRVGRVCRQPEQGGLQQGLVRLDLHGPPQQQVQPARALGEVDPRGARCRQQRWTYRADFQWEVLEQCGEAVVHPRIFFGMNERSAI